MGVKGQDFIQRLRDAEARGWARGIANKQDDQVDFQTGEEYKAWLRGWRLAQAELRDQNELDKLLALRREEGMKQAASSIQAASERKIA